MVPSKEHDHKEELFARPRKRRTEVCVGDSVLGSFKSREKEKRPYSRGVSGSVEFPKSSV